jgi:hypothetical protein
MPVSAEMMRSSTEAQCGLGDAGRSITSSARGEQHRSPTHAPVTRQVSLLGVFYRCDMIIMRVILRRAHSLSSSIHFPPSESPTKPACTGSPTSKKTIGMVLAH